MMSSEELLNLKYSDLQKLAKTHGIKANQKSEKLIEALKLIITSKNETSKEIISEENESRDVDEFNVVDVDSENKTNTSTTKRKRSSVVDKPLENSAQKSRRSRSDSAPAKGAEQARPPNGPESPKKSATTGKPVLPKDENVDGQDAVTGSAGKNTRSRKKEDPGTDSTRENQPKKRLRESSEAEELFEPMRKRLRSSLETKGTVTEKNEASKKQTTNIPRHSKLLKAQKKTAEYWSKMHQRNQDRLESIDDYQKKKQTRAALLLSGSKKDKARAARVLGSRSSPRLTAVVKPLMDKVFVPEVLTTDKMDLNFGKEATTSRKNSPGKRPNDTFAKDKSPGFRTPGNQRKSLTGRNANSNLKPSLFSPRAANASMLSASKPKFDLAKSLERPLTWVPYKGKVKPIEEEKNRLRVDVKEVKTRSRQQRTAEAKSGWKSRRASELMKKRGAK